MRTNLRDERKLEEDEIEYNFQFRIVFSNKKLQLKEHELNLKRKKIEGLLWFFKGKCTNHGGCEKKEGKNWIGTKSDGITMHALLREVGPA